MSSSIQITRREFVKAGAAALSTMTLPASLKGLAGDSEYRQPNILYIMTDQQRFDTITALGNKDIYTPNFDRLVRRGVTFTNAYSTCPVCVPARVGIHTGCTPPTTRVFSNETGLVTPAQLASRIQRCGPYLPAVMNSMGYRSFGIGKFHTCPWDENLGYQLHLHSEELYSSYGQRCRDAYASWIANNHPEFDFIEGLMGERTEMYYMPQMHPMPAQLNVASWATQRAIEQIKAGKHPYFGLVSFIGPHPPFAPPIPFNRMYDPERMQNPVCGDIEIDHADEQITFMNYVVWANEITNLHARILKSRYYGEISFLDHCIGRLLDTVESRPDAGNTVICFFSDHGDHLGDHHAWQKESFFEQSCHVPFLLSWPDRLPQNTRRSELVCLEDLFAVATGAAGKVQTKEGIDVLGMLDGQIKPREFVAGYYGEPGTSLFKVMIRTNEYKYIYLANGAREQLFDMRNDPNELKNLVSNSTELEKMQGLALNACKVDGTADAITHDSFKKFPFVPRKLTRAYQFDASRGVLGFPDRPSDVYKQFNEKIQF
jgi:arylsulfatase